jgi:hypothetical protein
MLRTAEDAGAWPLPPAVARATPWPAWLNDPRPACDRVLAAADRYRWWLWGVTLLFYLAAFNGQWRVQPDAALYLSIGRNLAGGHGYTYLGRTNRLAYPGWPLMIAATFRVFGSSSLVPIHGLLLLLTLGTLASTYRLFLLHAGRPTAVVVTVGTALTKAFFVYTLELWSDLPFALGAMALLAGYEGSLARRAPGAPVRRARWYDWGLLVGGLGVAMSMRPTGWPLLLAVVLALAFDAVRGRLRWGTLLAVGAVVVVVAATCVAVDPRRAGGEALGGTYEQYVINRMAGGAAPLDRPFAQKVYSLFAWAASDVLFQVRFGPSANAILSAVVLLLGAGLFRARVLWGLWFTLLLVTILLMVQEVLDRYFLPVLPLLVFGWWSALVWADRRLSTGTSAVPVASPEASDAAAARAAGSAARRWPRLAADGLFVVLLGFGGVANLSKIGGLIAQQRARPFLANYDRGRYEPVPGLSTAIARRVGPAGLVLVKPPYARVVAFLSGRDVENANELTPAQVRSRRVFVIEPTDLKIRALLDKAGLVIGPALYTAPPAPAVSAKAEPLSLHIAVPR